MKEKDLACVVVGFPLLWIYVYLFGSRRAVGPNGVDVAINWKSVIPCNVSGGRTQKVTEIVSLQNYYFPKTG